MIRADNDARDQEVEAYERVARDPSRSGNSIRGQMTVEDCIRQAQADELEDWYRQQGAAEPQFGGY